MAIEGERENGAMRVWFTVITEENDPLEYKTHHTGNCGGLGGETGLITCFVREDVCSDISDETN